MKKKFIFVGRMLGIAFVINGLLFFASKSYLTRSVFTPILVMGPVAVSGILAVVVSEISDKRRDKKNEEKIQRND